MQLIFRTDIQKPDPGDTVQPQAVEASFWKKVKAEIPPSCLGTDKNFQRKPGNLGAVSGTGAVILKSNDSLPPNPLKNIQKYLILQGMYKEIVLPGKKIIVKKFPIQKGTSHKAKGHGFGTELNCLHQIRIKGSPLNSKRRSETVSVGFPGLFRFQDSKAFIFPALISHGLKIRHRLHAFGQEIAEGRNGERLPVSQKIEKKEMKQQIIVRKAFGFPGCIKGIGGNLLAVHVYGDLLSTGGIVGMNIPIQIAFNPPPFVVIGPPAFFPEFTSHLKAIEEKLPHIIPNPFKIFNKFLKVRHRIPF